MSVIKQPLFVSVVQCFTEVPGDKSCRATTFCDNSSLICPTGMLKADGAACGDAGTCQQSGALPCQSVCTEFLGISCLCGGATSQCHVCCMDNITALTPWCPQGYMYTTKSHVNTSVGNLTACFDDALTGPNYTDADVTGLTGSRPFAAFGASVCRPASDVLTLSPYATTNTRTLGMKRPSHFCCGPQSPPPPPLSFSAFQLSPGVDVAYILDGE